MKSNYRIILWVARVSAILILIFSLPFYFAEGISLPFSNSTYSYWDNTWLTVFPFMFIGLAVGWVFPKIGGLLITISIITGSIIGLFINGEIVSFMAIPFTVGILFLILGFHKHEDKI